MNGAVPLSPHVPSRCGQRKLYLYFLNEEQLYLTLGTGRTLPRGSTHETEFLGHLLVAVYFIH